MTHLSTPKTLNSESVSCGVFGGNKLTLVCHEAELVASTFAGLIDFTDFRSEMGLSFREPNDNILPT